MSTPLDQYAPSAPPASAFATTTTVAIDKNLDIPNTVYTSRISHAANKSPPVDNNTLSDASDPLAAFMKSHLHDGNSHPPTTSSYVSAESARAPSNRARNPFIISAAAPEAYPAQHPSLPTQHSLHSELFANLTVHPSPFSTGSHDPYTHVQTSTAPASAPANAPTFAPPTRSPPPPPPPPPPSISPPLSAQPQPPSTPYALPASPPAPSTHPVPTSTPVPAAAQAPAPAPVYGHAVQQSIGVGVHGGAHAAAVARQSAMPCMPGGVMPSTPASGVAATPASGVPTMPAMPSPVVSGARLSHVPVTPASVAAPAPNSAVAGGACASEFGGSSASPHAPYNGELLPPPVSQCGSDASARAGAAVSSQSINITVGAGESDGRAGGASVSKTLVLPEAGGFRDFGHRLAGLAGETIVTGASAAKRLVALKTRLNELQHIREGYWTKQAGAAGAGAAAAVMTMGFTLAAAGAAGLHQRNRLEQVKKAMRGVMQQINQLRLHFAGDASCIEGESRVTVSARVFTRGIERAELSGDL